MTIHMQLLFIRLFPETVTLHVLLNFGSKLYDT